MKVVLGGLGICCSLDLPAHLCLQMEKTRSPLKSSGTSVVSQGSSDPSNKNNKSNNKIIKSYMPVYQI